MATLNSILSFTGTYPDLPPYPAKSELNLSWQSFDKAWYFNNPNFGNNPNEALTIPESADGYPITRFYADAFYNKNLGGVKSLYINFKINEIFTSSGFGDGLYLPPQIEELHCADIIAGNGYTYLLTYVKRLNTSQTIFPKLPLCLFLRSSHVSEILESNPGMLETPEVANRVFEGSNIRILHLNSCKTVGTDAFKNSEIEELYLPSLETMNGESSLRYCTHLRILDYGICSTFTQSRYLPSTLQKLILRSTVKVNTSYKVSISGLEIYVPDELITEYQADPNYNENTIRGISQL